MPDDYRIIDVITAHRPYGLDCKCGEPTNSDLGWANHLLGALRRNNIEPVELPEPDYRVEPTEDENGFWEWSYPHGSIATADDGCVMWDQWHIYDTDKIVVAAAALLAAAKTAQEGK